VDLFGFKIRPAVEGDTERLTKLLAELADFHLRAAPDRFVKPEPGHNRAEIEALLSRPGAAILVAEDSAFPHLIGFVTVHVRDMPALGIAPARCYAEIPHLGVARHARRHGVGRALMREALAFAEAHGACALELDVHEFNAGAIAFYEALGFSIERRRLRMRIPA
jgi:diamine N-acetyltransferase